MRKLLIIIGILVLLVISGLIFSLNKKPVENKTSTTTTITSGKTYKMILGKDSYEPQDITIKKGDIIEFSTSEGKPFWPASDIHPTHGIYPEFDPQDAIQPDKTWSFKFEKIGTWRYHDHLAPYITGKITVE